MNVTHCRFTCAAIALGFAASMASSAPARSQSAAALSEARAFIAEHESRIRPLEITLNRLWWDANASGADAAYQAKEAAQNRLDEALADPDRFAKLKGIRAAIQKADPTPGDSSGRQIELLYLQYLEKQVDPVLLKQIAAKSNVIEKAFNAYRAKVDGKELSDSEVRKIFKTSSDSRYRKAVWEANKGVGAVVEADLQELVRLRNQTAQKLGFRNYHDMSLQLNEQNPAQVLQLFDELDVLIRVPFKAAKAEIDAQLAKHCGIAVADLRPWHYQDPFFQEAPASEAVSFDPVYAKADLVKLCREFYAGIGLPVDSVLARSDLYEKKGKNPHAFCTDLDRDGDVRVLANIVPSGYWMGTMLHELGHSVYSSLNIAAKVPYVLRLESHPVTTEGIAMMFEQFATRVDWMEKMGFEIPNRQALQQAGAKERRNQLLIFTAWAQVMFRFEMAMYNQPEQDLNQLWWKLVERYQLVHRPDQRNAPDYGAKIHIAQYPCYYHNYLMGQLFASQVHHAIARTVLRTEPAKALYNGRKEVGDFLKTKVFGPGRSLAWNDLARFATGRELNAQAFAEDLTKTP